MSSLLMIPALVWLIVSGLMFAVGEFLSKKFALQPSWIFLCGVVAMYVIASLTWLPALMQKGQLSITGALWSVISLLMTVGIGIVIFGERPSVLGIAGIICALIAVFLLSLS